MKKLESILRWAYVTILGIGGLVLFYGLGKLLIFPKSFPVLCNLREPELCIAISTLAFILIGGIVAQVAGIALFITTRRNNIG